MLDKHMIKSSSLCAQVTKTQRMRQGSHVSVLLREAREVAVSNQCALKTDKDTNGDQTNRGTPVPGTDRTSTTSHLRRLNYFPLPVRLTEICPPRQCRVYQVSLDTTGKHWGSILR